MSINFTFRIQSVNETLVASSYQNEQVKIATCSKTKAMTVSIFLIKMKYKVKIVSDNVLNKKTKGKNV